MCSVSGIRPAPRMYTGSAAVFLIYLLPTGKNRGRESLRQRSAVPLGEFTPVGSPVQENMVHLALGHRPGRETVGGIKVNTIFPYEFCLHFLDLRRADNSAVENLLGTSSQLSIQKRIIRTFIDTEHDALLLLPIRETGSNRAGRYIH